MQFVRLRFGDRGVIGIHPAFSKRSLAQSLLVLVLLAQLPLLGCGRPSAPLETDLSKTPWLDPQMQVKSLQESDPRVRGLAAQNLGNLGAKAVSALPDLERIAENDPDQKVRERARSAVDKIKAASK